MNRITVTGAVQRPGVYTLPRPSSDLVTALAAAGGLIREAGPKIAIQSRTPVAAKRQLAEGDADSKRSASNIEQASWTEAVTSQTDRREIRLVAGPAAKLPFEELADGDIVTVERREPPGVLVTGMVQQPGRYEMPASGEFRILDAVASAHGMVYKVMDTVLVCRAVPGSAERAVITVSLRAATRDDRENLLLMSGDIVSVEPNAHVLIQDALQYIRSAALGVAPVMLH